jgi:epoxyqueuosine reductase
MLISRRIGSWFVLGAILTNLELDYDPQENSTFCGTCTRCLDACPTDAFPEPGVLDARRCISYLTIEQRTNAIPETLRSAMGDWMFGCDVCQDVCPWNRFAPDETIDEFRAMERRVHVDGRTLLRMSSEQFDGEFRNTPLSRPGRAGLLRNIAIVLGNLKDLTAEPELTTALDDSEPLIRGAAAWALGQLGTSTAFPALQKRLAVEQDPNVALELQAAMNQCSKNLSDANTMAFDEPMDGK